MGWLSTYAQSLRDAICAPCTGFELLERDARVNLALAGESGETAIAARDHSLAPHDACVLLDPLRDEFRVLDEVEQALFNAQLAYVATQSQLFQSYANLYKAMGGGWEADRY